MARLRLSFLHSEPADTANGAGFRQSSARVEAWSRDLTRLVCAGAGVRGRCVSTLHSSISPISMKKAEGKQLKKLRFSMLREVEQTRSSPARMEQERAPVEANGQFGRVKDRGEVETLQGGVLANHRPSHSQVFSWWADFSACWPVGQSVEAPQIAHNQFVISQTEFRPARRRVRSDASAGTWAYARAGICGHA